MVKCKLKGCDKDLPTDPRYVALYCSSACFFRSAMKPPHKKTELDSKTIKFIFVALYDNMSKKLKELNEEISRTKEFDKGNDILYGMELMSKVISDVEATILRRSLNENI